MARAASYTVQKQRSRIHRASFSPSPSSTGRSSSWVSTALRFLPSAGISSTASTMPSVRRLPAPKGTITRMPGSSASSSSGGTR